ncbi:phage major capsid protein [Nesterenkonia sp. AY15]|uniref:phage major capsid protein n=1 Tax=Nesterenkonia sp. AY15 TaxID=2901139 RepID=UPI001F4CCABD|nr:phage major capsid protein [Nesterenkonia sp. AY15]MCH8571510.1 phage major capsid protein [Nesterenkonia sp. AY15]
MAMYTNTDTVSGILPRDHGDLIVEPVTQSALAFNPLIATIARTGSNEFSVPVVREDAGAAWVAEGQEIDEDDATLDELLVRPSKVAGLTVVSSELARDSSPSAQKVIADGLVRSIVDQVDRAFFGNLVSPAPSGLEGHTPAESLTTDLSNLDALSEAVSLAETGGANVTAFVADPVTALALATLKQATGSNQALLGNNPRQIIGREVLVSRHVAAGTIWAIDASRIVTVLRTDAELAVSDQSHFSSDRIAVRATLRTGFAFASAYSALPIRVNTAA